MRAFSSIAVLALGLAGCNDDLPKISLISEMDIFGQRVSVIGDEGRATPRPGESATVSLSLVYPEPGDHDDELSIAVLECSYPDRFVGAPVCQEFIDAIEGGAESPVDLPGDAELSCDGDLEIAAGGLTLRCLRGRRDFELSVADGATSAKRLLVGVVCRNSIATLSGGEAVPGFRCEPADQGTPEEEAFTSTIALELSEADRNQNPDLSTANITLDGSAWPPSVDRPQVSDCDDPTPDLPEFELGRSYTLAAALSPDNRERVDGELETLRLSHRATHGEFERGASYLLPDRKADKDGKLVVKVAWTAPRRRGDSSRLIMFHFGLRDGRGGFSETTRHACLPR